MARGLTSDDVDGLVRLAERATSPSARVRRQAAEVAAQLLPALGLDEGRYGPDGTRTGGSSGFEATAAALPAEARAAVAVLGLVADPAVLPSGLPTTGRAVGKVLLGGVAAAIGAAGTATAVGLATGDVARVVTAGITGAAALVGQVAALRADRAHGRLTELLRAAADTRRGLPPDARAVHDRAVVEALDEVARDRADVVADRRALARLAELAGRSGVDAPSGSRPRPAERLAERLAGVGPATTAGRRDRTTSDGARADGLAVPTAVGPDATPARRAWARKAMAGPLAAATVTAVGFAVAAAVGVAVPLTVTGGLVAGLAAVGLVTVVEHAQARLRATLDGRRTDVEEARRAVRAAAEHAARAAAGRALDARVAADAQQAERTAGRLDALLADAAAGRAVTARDLATATARPPAQEPAVTPTVDQLVPGPRTGPVDPAALTDADRARLADLTRALDDVRATRGRGRAAVVARAREVAAVLGLDAPLGTALRTDPDELGWPHRRAVLDQDLQLRLAALDELPSAVPAPGWAVARGLAASLLPSATGAVLGAATLGVGPAVALALAPVALTVSSAVVERLGALSKENGKRPGSLWSAAAADALADADARRAADRADAAAALADQQAENRRRADELDRLHRTRRRRPPRTVVPSAPPVPVGPVDADDATAPTSSAPEPSGGRPRYAVAVARAVVPAAVVVGGAVTVFATATNLDPATMVLPGTWDSLGAAAVPVLAGSVAAAVSGLASVAAAGGDALAGRSGFDREAARSRAAEARRARWAQVERAAVDAALDAARADADTDRAQARADLSAARAELDDAPWRGPAGPGCCNWCSTGRPRWWRPWSPRWATSSRRRRPPRPLRTPRTPRTSPCWPGRPSSCAPPRPGTGPSTCARCSRGRASRVCSTPARTPPAAGWPSPGRWARWPRRSSVPRPPSLPWPRTSSSGAGCAPSPTPPGGGQRRCAGARPGAPCTCAGPTADGTVPAAPAPEPAPAPPAGPEAAPAPPAAQPPVASSPAGPAASPAAPAASPPAQRPVPPLPYSPRPTPAPAPAQQHHPAPPAPPATDPGRPVVDVEEWPDGPGRTTSAVVTVVAPGGARVDLLVRWVDPGAGQRPVLVLSDVPGSTFWWGVPVAVQQAAAQALAALQPSTARAAAAVVVGQRDGQPPVLSELPVTLGGPGPELVPGRGPRQLDPAETAAAVTALRLRPVADLLGRLRQVPAGR